MNDIEDQVRAVLESLPKEGPDHARMVAKLRELYDEDAVEDVRAGRWVWYCVITAMQLVATHPWATDCAVIKQALDFAVDIGAQMGADDELLGEILARGWEHAD